MNILDKAALHECTSCQLCATMCARGAIKIGLNKAGFYRPVVDADLCTDCGLCTKVCYKFDENLRTTEVKPSCEKELFSAWFHPHPAGRAPQTAAVHPAGSKGF